MWKLETKGCFVTNCLYISQYYTSYSRSVSREAQLINSKISNLFMSYPLYVERKNRKKMKMNKSGRPPKKKKKERKIEQQISLQQAKHTKLYYSDLFQG